MTTMDIPVIATEIAAAIMAASSAAFPSHELMLQRFTDAYDRLGALPSESDHQRVCDLVRAMITRPL
jgi:hypothetical protein